MKKRRNFRVSSRTFVPIIAGLVLVGGSAAIASGALPGGEALAAVVAAISGQPTLIVSRASNAVGTVENGRESTIAVFDVKAKNVTHQANLYNLNGQIVINSSAAAWMYVWPVHAYYYYCIPTGVKYGYGYTGTGGCQTISLNSTYATNSAQTRNKITGTMAINFSGIAPVYPQASTSHIIITGAPQYSYTGPVGKNGTADGNLHVELINLFAKGDQCSYTQKYGYTNCMPKDVTVNIVNNGPKLVVPRPYGYGYKGVPNPVVSLAMSRPDNMLNTKVQNGTPAVKIGTVTLKSAGGVVNVNKLTLGLATGHTWDIGNVYAYVGSTKVGIANILQDQVVMTLTSPIAVNPDVQKTITLKVDVSPIGLTPAQVGDQVQIRVISAQGTNGNSDSIVTTTSGVVTDTITLK